MRIMAATILLLATSTSFADDGSQELAAALKPIAPSKGLDKAPLHAAPWCASVKRHDDQWAYTLKDRLDNFHPRGSSKPLFEAAGLVCSAGTSAVGQRATQIIEQLWINETGLSDADAVISLTAHANVEQFEAERDKLCAQIPEQDSDEQRRVLANARRDLFGCDGEPLWSGRRPIEEIHDYVDRGEVETDPQLRLAWAIHRLFIDLDSTSKLENTLPGYAMDQFDLHQPADSAMHSLDAPPYRGNRAAHVIVMESLANVHMNVAHLEQAVAAKPEWHDLLVTLPQKAFEAWNTAAAHHKDAIAHADEVMAKLRAKDQPTGCEATLRADLAPILKGMKHDTVSTLLDQVSDDPLAGFLLGRLARCVVSAPNSGRSAGEWIENFSYAVRSVSGPRMAAWYALVDAIGAQKSRAPFHMRDVTELESVSDERRGSFDVNEGSRGVIASVAKTAKGMKLTFVHERAQIDDWKCVEGTKIDRIDSEGKVTYRQVCHAIGKIWIDNAPEPTTVPTRWAAGLAKGRFVRFRASDDDSMPAEVWADKSQKRLVAFYGFEL
jgi:hypothetical protein